TLKSRRVVSLVDLADGSVPSLRIAPFEARTNALTIGIRGIVPLDANQPAREQGVGIYIDGVYLGRQHGVNTALFDVERVEVLKGPQGTLFGRNTEGGALSIVNRAPTGVFGGRITGGVGNYGSYNGELHLDLPSFHDFAVKVDGVVQHQDATTINPAAGQAGWNLADRQGLRAAVRWTPVDNLTNDFSYDVAHSETTPFYSQLLNYNPNSCPTGGTSALPIAASTAPNCYLPGTAYTGLQGVIKPVLPGITINGATRMKVADLGVPQQPSIDNTHGFTNTLKYKVSPDIELRSITAWRGVTSTQWDNSGGAHRPPVVAPGCTGNGCNFSRYSLANLRQNQFSQELQAVGTLGPVDYVAGLYYFIENVSDDAATPNSLAIAGYTTAGQTSGYSFVTLDPCVGSGGFGSQPGCRSIDRASAVRSRSYAAYGQATWHATDALSVIVGGRYTEDKKQGRLLLSRNVNYAANPIIAATNGYKPLDEKWSRFNPMATVAYQASDDIYLYAKYATGYRAGGASSRTANYQAFNPEDVKSYEIGLKTDLFDHHARFNLVGYMMDRKDSQVDISSVQFTATGNFNNLVTINAPGNTKIRGVEADLTVQPFEGLTLNAAYTYTYTRIPPVLITASAVSGTPPVTTSTSVLQQFYIVYTPRNAASGAIDYSLPVGSGDTALRFHLDAAYSQATQAFDQFATKNDASFLVNGRISLTEIKMGEGQKLNISLWARNLFNEQFLFRRDPSNSLPASPTTSVTTGNVGNILGDYGNFNQQRTFGVEGTVRF
ncbi:MAG: TonB-dependent receptor, partial [Sandarakinorhabdus sp.]|nr:TonB-dependent receptor [Sandarakinorhabdus sp.]